MKFNFKKAAAVVLVLAMCVSAMAGCGGKSDYTANNTEYIIGVSGPLTGDAAPYGISVQNSAQMAVDEINAAGGLDGVKFKLIVTDDMHDATKVSTNYSSMLESGMQVSLGTVTTNPCLEFANLSAEDNVFFLTPSASGDKVPAYDNGYQMCFADGNQGKVAADYVNSALEGKSIGVFYKADDAYSKGIFDQFKANISGTVSIIETSFTDANKTDFGTQISTLKDCEFIFMPIYSAPAALFMTQAKGIVRDDAVYYGCDGFDGIENIEGFDISVISQEVSMLSHFNSKATEGKAKEFIDKYTEKFGSDTLSQFGASAYDCVYAIYGAMKAAGDKVNVTMSASELCEVLKAQFNGGYVYENGATGSRITWESNGYVNKEAIKYVIKEATVQ